MINENPAAGSLSLLVPSYILMAYSSRRARKQLFEYNDCAIGQKPDQFHNRTYLPSYSWSGCNRMGKLQRKKFYHAEFRGSQQP